MEMRWGVAALAIAAGCDGGPGPQNLRPHLVGIRGYHPVLVTTGGRLLAGYLSEETDPAPLWSATSSNGSDWTAGASVAAAAARGRDGTCPPVSVAAADAVVAFAYGVPAADGVHPGLSVSRDGGASFTASRLGELSKGGNVSVAVRGGLARVAFIGGAAGAFGDETLRVATYDVASGTFGAVASLGEADLNGCTFVAATASGLVLTLTDPREGLRAWSSQDGATWSSPPSLAANLAEVRGLVSAGDVIVAPALDEPFVGFRRPGIARTLDQGRTWKVVETLPAVALAGDGVKLWGVFLDGTSPRRFKMMRGDGAGADWRLVTENLEGLWYEDLAVAASGPMLTIVYRSAMDSELRSAVSMDGGLDWSW